MQNHYNLLYREEEREMMPTLKVGLFSPYVVALYSNVYARTKALRCWVHSMVTTGPWVVDSSSGCDDEARWNGRVSLLYDIET